MRFSLRRCLLLAILVCLLVGILLGIYISKRDDEPGNTRQGHSVTKTLPVRKGIFLQKLGLKPNENENGRQQQQQELSWQKRGARPSNKNPAIRDKSVDSKKKSKAPIRLDRHTVERLKLEYPVQQHQRPSYDVHAFYYTWYGNEKLDGKYYHWDHRFLPHWNKRESKKWRSGRHQPPDDIGSSYFPELGTYSSTDPNVIAQHMVHLRTAGVGVLSLSWYPPGRSDDEGKPTDGLVPVVLDIADIYGIKVNFHIEPYRNRTPKSLREDIQYIMDQYGHHPAFYRHRHKGMSMPVFYMYDSYLISASDWAALLKPGGKYSVRGTDIDGVFIGLLVEKKHETELVDAGFDGFYTYFASNRFTFGSNWDNWGHLGEFAQTRGLLFIPSVGPGYIDTEVRPWNGANTKSRERGSYYESGFQAAIEAKPSIITITSFNEWHEGTQIEPAIVKKRGKEDYLNYTPGRPEYYLDLTRKFVKTFQEAKVKSVLKNL